MTSLIKFNTKTREELIQMLKDDLDEIAIKYGYLELSHEDFFETIDILSACNPRKN